MDTILVAIEKLKFKCTISEVTVQSGLPVDVVEMEMASLMRDSGGVINEFCSPTSFLQLSAISHRPV